MAQLLCENSLGLAVTGYPAAHQMLEEELSRTIPISNKREQLSTQESLIFLPAQERELLRLALRELADLRERVCLIKNYELYCDYELLRELTKLPRLILAGEEEPALSPPPDWAARIHFSSPGPGSDYRGEYWRRGGATGSIKLRA